jgi:phosphoserine phosphatase RsbU/P
MVNTPSNASVPAQEDSRLPIQRSDEAMTMFRHDLMTPINLILGYTEMLEERFEGGEKDVMADLGKIKTATRQLMGLIDENMRPPSARGEQVIKTASALPATTAPFPGSQVPAAAESMSQECFLVADDDEHNRELLTRLLQKEGYRSVTAANGVEALEVLKRQPIDVILLDVKMPEMDGFELLDRLKGDSGLKHIPVIMVSAFTELERTARCIKQGAEDYLPKPFNSTLLLARVSACLEKKRLRDTEQKMFRELAESRQALADELNEAAAHVRSLLPAPLKDQPQSDWRFEPSTLLGGDAFGYFPLDTDHLVIFLLDVCGHGVSAALHSISVMNALRARSLPDANFHDPASVMFVLNNRFQMADHNNMYFTIWYGVYTRSRRTLAYSSAGHPPAVLVSKDELGPCARKLGTGGPIIGMMPDLKFKSAQIQVPPGARLFVFSDGTYELTKTTGGMLTFEEFVDALAAPPPADKAALEHITAFARQTHGPDPFEDDFSIVQLQF